jgi:hypothetical protein
MDKIRSSAIMKTINERRVEVTFHAWSVPLMCLRFAGFAIKEHGSGGMGLLPTYHCPIQG